MMLGDRIITIEGNKVRVPYTARRIQVRGLEVLADGKVVFTLPATTTNVHIEVDGHPIHIHVDNGDIIVNGDVKGNISTNGNVVCGDVGGYVSANGNVQCGMAHKVRAGEK